MFAVVQEAIKKHTAKFVDLRFTNIQGKEQHITLPVCAIDEELMTKGKTFDGSSFKGWQKIHQSDLALLPDVESLLLDPFFDEKTLILRCDVINPKTMQAYEKCPRSIAKRAEKYLKDSGVADKVFFGPEPEFFVFDDVRWETNISGCFYKIDSSEAQWNSGKTIEGGNIGHRPSVKGGYFPVPPVDSSHELRSALCMMLEKLGIVVEAHHHEVATANQCEIATKFSTLLDKADEMQVFKYVVHNLAHNYGKTATFMPKPLIGDNGSGMHCHQSLLKGDVNIFAGDEYSGLSKTALYYIGGIIKHARSLNAFTNPSTNSYRRLVPGFEAPVMLTYSAMNRSASIRIPHVNNTKAQRIEVRFPDGTANPYLAFSAMLMAGLDGIKNKIHPGDSLDEDLYNLTSEQKVNIPTVANSLDQALDNLENDQAFLLEGGVFTKAFIDNYIDIKKQEINYVRSLTHPYEFELYYSL